jgi:hypothetical protein
MTSRGRPPKPETYDEIIIARISVEHKKMLNEILLAEHEVPREDRIYKTEAEFVRGAVIRQIMYEIGFDKLHKEMKRNEQRKKNLKKSNSQG